MGFFNRKTHAAGRYPPERLAELPGLLGMAIQFLVIDDGLNSETVFGSRFIAGYLLGYPDLVDGIDEQWGATIRQMIFDAIYGSEKGRAMFTKAMGHYLLDDAQIKLGWGAGVPDGQRYFRALESGSATDEAWDSLKTVFKFKSVDFSLQTL